MLADIARRAQAALKNPDDLSPYIAAFEALLLLGSGWGSGEAETLRGILSGPGRDAAARSLQTPLLSLLPRLADEKSWFAEYHPGDELLPLDQALVSILGEIGPTGTDLALAVREKYTGRLYEKLDQHQSVGTDPAGWMEDWLAPEGGPSWRSDPECPDPAGSRAWRLVALAVWRDRIRPAADLAASLVSRHPAPAIASGILHGTLRKLAYGQPERGEDGELYLRGEGERLRVAASVAPEVAEALLRGLNELGGVVGDRLIRAAVRWAWERRGILDARTLRFEGGRSTLRERLGITKNQDSALYDALEAGTMFRFKRGGLEVMSLWTYFEIKAAPGRRAEASWTIGELLAPGAPWRELPANERRAIPVLAEPDLQGFNSRHVAPLLRLQWELLVLLAERVPHMEEDGWIPFGLDARNEARERAEAPADPTREALVRWAGPGGWFEDRNGSAVRLVDPAARALWDATAEGAERLAARRKSKHRRERKD